MKLLFAVLFVALASVVHAKKELKSSDCGGDDSLLTLGSLTDLKSSGAIDKHSTLKIIFSAAKDTHSKDPFDVDLEIEVKKKIAFWFVKIPQALMDRIGHGIHDDQVKYLGRSVFRVRCLFLHLYKTCLPAKGPHVEEVHMDHVLEGVKKLGKIVRWFGSGWYQLNVKGTTSNREKAMCVKLQFNLHL